MSEVVATFQVVIRDEFDPNTMNLSDISKLMSAILAGCLEDFYEDDLIQVSQTYIMKSGK